MHARSYIEARRAHAAPSTTLEPLPESVDVTALDTWAEDLGELTLLHEHDRLGDWVTVFDDAGDELCMYTALDAPLDEAAIARICEWRDL